MVVRDSVDGAHEHASAEVSIEIDRSSSFWSKVSPGSNKLTSDPRVDALGWRLAIIERRMGLREKDEAADADAVERLAKLLPPPPATES
jgi:hypothetical protein